MVKMSKYVSFTNMYKIDHLVFHPLQKNKKINIVKSELFYKVHNFYKKFVES